MRLTANDIRIMRREAEREAKRYSRARRFVIEIGERHNIDEDRGTNINILLITREPEGWDDTDLYTTNPWSDIRKPLTMTDDNRAMLDFYIYEMERGERGDLVCNAQAEIDQNGLLAIHADIEKNRWHRP